MIKKLYLDLALMTADLFVMPECEVKGPLGPISRLDAGVQRLQYSHNGMLVIDGSPPEDELDVLVSFLFEDDSGLERVIRPVAGFAARRNDVQVGAKHVRIGSRLDALNPQ